MTNKTRIGKEFHSNVWGPLGYFKEIGKGLFQSLSGRVLVLGERPRGKGEGTILLDKICGEYKVNVPERSIIVDTEYYLNIPPQPLENPCLAETLAPEKVRELITILKQHNFPQYLAVRSSSSIEDTITGSQICTAAGVFGTDYFAEALDNQTAFNHFQKIILNVINSNYSPWAIYNYKKNGCQEIPPLSLIIQELVGNDWEYAPSVYFPALSGIINTAHPEKIKMVANIGFALSAVKGEDCMGFFRVFDKETGQKIETQRFYSGLIHFLDKNKKKMSSSNDNDENYYKLYPREESAFSLEEVLWKESKILPAIASTAARLEEKLGYPLDIEWAKRLNEDVPVFYQIRPVKAKEINIPRPNSVEKSFIKTNEVVGQGQRTFTHAIYAKSFTYPPAQIMEDLSARYPNSVLIVDTWLTGNTNDWFLENVFPFYKTVVVLEENALHPQRDGIDHFSLNCMDNETIILYAPAMLENIGQSGNLIENRILREHRKGETCEVYAFKKNLHLAADDETDPKWGMLYLPA